MDSNPMVSILMLTYNHERYLSYAIKSVMNQKTNFKFELLISDDASTDKTKEIINEYEKIHHNKIISTLRILNLGAMINMRELTKRAKGKYIAYLEGDDYWIDEFKLQKQVDFLENNLGIFSSGHLYKVIDDFNNIIGYQSLKLKGDKKFNRAEILKHGTNVAHPNSIVHKNFYITRPEIIDDFFSTNEFGFHSLLLLYLGTKSDIYMFNSYMSTWRKIVSSESDSFSSFSKKNRTKVALNNVMKYFYYSELMPNEYDFRSLIRLNFAKYTIAVLIGNDSLKEKLSLIQNSSYLLQRYDFLLIPFLMIKLSIARLLRF